MWNRAAHQSNAPVFDRSAVAAGLAARGADRVFDRSTPFDMSGLAVRYPMPFFIEKEEVHELAKNGTRVRSVFA